MEPSTEYGTENGTAGMLEAVRAIDREHWLNSYINGLVQAFKDAHKIDFETAEMLLAREKQAFEKELATARKIYRLYPYLVDQAKASQHVESA